MPDARERVIRRDRRRDRWQAGVGQGCRRRACKNMRARKGAPVTAAHSEMRPDMQH